LLGYGEETNVASAEGNPDMCSNEEQPQKLAREQFEISDLRFEMHLQKAARPKRRAGATKSKARNRHVLEVRD
jgi:hypothetical protein